MTDTPRAERLLPVFPLRGIVLFPYVLAPFSAGRPASVSAIEAAVASEEKDILVITQRDPEDHQPDGSDLYAIGTRAVVKRLARSQETIEILLQGVERVRCLEITQTTPHLVARVEPLPLPEAQDDVVTEALRRELYELGHELKTLVRMPAGFDLDDVVRKVASPMHLTFILASFIDLEQEEAQAFLESANAIEAMHHLHTIMTHELNVLRLRKEIAGQAESQMSNQQRQHMLRQQLRAIQQELGELGSEHDDIDELQLRLDEAALPKTAHTEAEKVLRRLRQMPPMAPDYQVLRTYLDTILDLPWHAATDDHIDLRHARSVLDEDHYGLDEIKERILEHLAVLKLNPRAKSPILCFVGPPGVGKTSLGQSIARALGRKFERFSLGGMHDEAELRGHRRTYVGAMPGRIIQAMRRAAVRNPLLMLDEVDKLGRDFRGDPASALLEILDPAQNFEFRDNYLDLPFDLSHTFFILTANTLDTIPGPLRDRLETIRLAGYTLEEKMEIARRYLFDRQREQAGLNEAQLILPGPTLQCIIERYTREAGVRELERMLGRIARKVALKVALAETETKTIEIPMLPDMLGAERYLPEEARRKLPPGVATGLAWTEAGGDVLYIEAIRLPGREELTLTGQLGPIMQESARAALSFIHSRAEALGIGERIEGGLHIHVPAGSIPKDGPSAGITMATAIASLYLGRETRGDTAMTGEITLSGLVLPVGGIKEKLLAARRAGIKRIVLPKQNEKDLRDLPPAARGELQIELVECIDDVLRVALVAADQPTVTTVIDPPSDDDGATGCAG